MSLVTTSDVNIESTIPINNVTAKPTIDADPSTQSTITPMSVVTLPSMIAPVERLKPVLIAVGIGFEECLYSSFTLSKMTTFASTAIPIESKIPAMPGKVSCTHGSTAQNQSKSTMYTQRARSAAMPSPRYAMPINTKMSAMPMTPAMRAIRIEFSPSVAEMFLTSEI